MKVTVYYRTSDLIHPPDMETLARASVYMTVATLEIPHCGGAHRWLLEKLFYLFNQDRKDVRLGLNALADAYGRVHFVDSRDQLTLDHWSMSPGDYVSLDGLLYRCNMVGWELTDWIEPPMPIRKEDYFR